MHVVGAVYLHLYPKNDFRCVMGYARMILSSIRQTLVLCAQCGFKTRVVTQSEHAHTVVSLCWKWWLSLLGKPAECHARLEHTCDFPRLIRSLSLSLVMNQIDDESDAVWESFPTCSS